MTSVPPTTAYAASRDPADLEACIQGMAAGDTEAFRQLYERTRAAVYGFALSLLRNAADAEDVVQDTYLRLHAGAPAYTPLGKPMAWILTIARNLALMRLRETGRQADLSEEGWAKLPDPHTDLTEDDRLMLDAVLSSLTPEERQIVTLHAVAGFRHREIADFLRLPLATVLSKYHRAMKKLRKRLTEGAA